MARGLGWALPSSPVDSSGSSPYPPSPPHAAPLPSGHGCSLAGAHLDGPPLFPSSSPLPRRRSLGSYLSCVVLSSSSVFFLSIWRSQLDRKRGPSSPVQAPQQPEKRALGWGSRWKRPLKHELLNLGFVLPALDADGDGEELLRRRKSSIVIEHEQRRILSSLSLSDPDAAPQADETLLGVVADGGGQGDPVRSSSTRIYSYMPATIHADLMDNPDSSSATPASARAVSSCNSHLTHSRTYPRP